MCGNSGYTKIKEDWEEGKIQDGIKGKARETGSKIKDFLGNAFLRRFPQFVRVDLVRMPPPHEI